MARNGGMPINDEWLLYKIRKAKAQLELDRWECPRESQRDPSDFKVFLTPRDEKEIVRQHKAKTKEVEHEKYLERIKKLKENLTWDNMWK